MYNLMKTIVMKQNKIFGLGMAAFLAAGLLTACSQEENVATGMVELQEANKRVTVDELTERLKAYNASVYGVTRGAESPWLRTSNKKGDKVEKVILADVEGALRGFKRFRFLGAVIGAIVSSLAEATKGDLFEREVDEVEYPNVYTQSQTAGLCDSIGYYHNAVEAEMYNMDRNSHQQPTQKLMNRADSIMERKSSEYAKTRTMDYSTAMAMSQIKLDIDKIRAIDNSDMTFDEYYAVLKQQNPEDSEYLDFAIEYIYVVNYANVDIDEYTEEVLFMINNSNADIEDAAMLSSCIQVAYASAVMPESKLKTLK